MFSARLSGRSNAIRKHHNAISRKNRYLYLRIFAIFHFKNYQPDIARNIFTLKAMTNGLPNINRIHIRLRRLFEPNFSARAQRVIEHKPSNKHECRQHGNRNQYFYPEFHSEENETRAGFLRYALLDFCISIIPTASCTVPIERYITRCSGILKATKKLVAAAINKSTYPYFLSNSVMQAILRMKREKRQENYSTESANQSSQIINLPPPSNRRVLRFRGFCLPFTSKVSDGEHQPEYYGADSAGGDKFKERFSAFHPGAFKFRAFGFCAFHKGRKGN
jgi:hypothetical protein